MGVVTPMIFTLGIGSVKSRKTFPALSNQLILQPNNFFGITLTTYQPTNQTTNKWTTRSTTPTSQPTQSYHQHPSTKWLTSRRLQLQSLCPIDQVQSTPSPPNARCWLSCNPNAPGKLWDRYLHEEAVRYTRVFAEILKIFINHISIQYPLTINIYLNYIQYQIRHFLPLMSCGFQSLLGLEPATWAKAKTPLNSTNLSWKSRSFHTTCWSSWLESPLKKWYNMLVFPCFMSPWCHHIMPLFHVDHLQSTPFSLG